jgi:hypothetical protein
MADKKGQAADLSFKVSTVWLTGPEPQVFSVVSVPLW